MIPFNYHNPKSFKDAASRLDHDKTQALAGGTTMLDLMKLNVLTPENVVYVREVLPSTIERDGDVLIAGAGLTMAAMADAKNGGIAFPAIRQSLILAASPQIRNMATLGGNLLQRPRSTYYRHTDMPVYGRSIANFGDDVDTSLLAVLGNGQRLVGMYPGDFGVSVVAFDADLELSDGSFSRRMKARQFFKEPEGSFHYGTQLNPNELISHIRFPVTSMLKNSIYLKVRERSSYAFALASAAVGLHIQDNEIVDARVGIGGLGSIPWHSPEAERVLIGQAPTDKVFADAAEKALEPANPPSGLEFKVALAKRTLVRALTLLRDHGPLNDEEMWAMQHGRSVDNKVKEA